MLSTTKMKLLNGSLISIKLEQGKTYLLKGPNGCGKSLTLRSLALLHKAPFESFTFNGKSIEQIDPQNFRKQVLYVPPVPLDTASTVAHFFQWPMTLKVYHDHSPDMRFQKELQSKGFWMRDFSLLSSGEKQYVQILRALSLRPKILLLDEVTSHMDKNREKEIESKLIEDQEAHGTTILMVSHDDNFLQIESAVRLSIKNDLSLAEATAPFSIS